MNKSEGAGIAGAAGIERMIQHYAAADEGAEEELGEIREARAVAEGEFGRTGCGRVVLDEDGQ